MADVFSFYDRYINGFLAALRRRVEDPTAPSATRRRGPIRNRYDLAVLVLIVVLLVALPAAPALAGVGSLALDVLLYPVGFAAGWALVYFVAGAYHRFGWLAAAPVAAVGFLAAFALLITASLVTDELFFGRYMPGGGVGGSGLAVGALVAVMSRSKPEGRRGELSAARDVRGARSLTYGVRRWLLGGPLLPGNFAFLGLTLLGGLPCLALGLFGLSRGLTEPFVFAFLALGLGNVLLGTAETIPLRLAWGKRRAAGSGSAYGAGRALRVRAGCSLRVNGSR